VAQPDDPWDVRQSVKSGALSTFGPLCVSLNVSWDEILITTRKHVSST
jgi:hypothetical protein